jgi:hypothetical protein
VSYAGFAAPAFRHGRITSHAVAVTPHRARLLAGLLAATALLAGCSRTTDGSGHVAGPPTGSNHSSPDFPSGDPGAPTDSPPTGPTDTSGPAPSDSGSGSGSGSGVHPAPGAPLRSVTVHAADATYVVDLWADVHDATCFDHAYGQALISFLTQHPCRGLERYLGTTTVNGRPVGFAESATSFAGTATDPYVYSSEFTRLEQADGTGSIDDLLRDGYRLPTGPTRIPSSEAFNVLGQDNGVTVWDAWYLDGPTPDNDKALVKMTTDIFLQF